MRGGKRNGAGRKKGKPNKTTQDVAERLAQLKCDPIEGMALIAQDPENTPELRGKMFAELAQYVAPKRKAIEHSGEMPGQTTVVIDLGGADDQAEASS
jgi:hypothetical protein